jgi:hypothetical protein
MMTRSLFFVLLLGVLIPSAFSGQHEIKVPVLKKTTWQRPLLLDKDLEENHEKTVKVWIDRVLKASGDEPLVPGFLPIVAGKQLLYRTYDDVRSVFLAGEKNKHGKVVSEQGELFFRSTPMDGSLANILAHSRLRSTMENWLNNTLLHQPKSVNFLFENSLQGSLTISHGLVYAVDDLAIPPPNTIFPKAWKYLISPDPKKYVLGNTLRAHELSTGRFRWRIGSDPENWHRNVDDFTTSHFLGAPLPIGERLYVINEKNEGAKGNR